MRFGLFLWCLLYFNLGFTQSALIPLGNPSYHMLDRIEIRSGRFFNSIHTSVKPYRRDETIKELDTLKHVLPSLSNADKFNIDYLSTDNFLITPYDSSLSKKPLLKYFYRHKASLLSHKSKHFYFSINPVLNFSTGVQSVTIGLQPSNYSNLYINTRGAELFGCIDDRVAFYTFVSENQMRMPAQVSQFADSTYGLPGEGYYKRFKNGVGGFDFFQARGYIHVKATNHISAQFGSDRQFIGNGYRSLIRSDFAKDNLFLRLNTNIWKINYTNVFSEFTDSAYTTGGNLYNKKYGALHHLSINIGKNFNLGLFETVVFARTKTPGTGTYELSYLNPIIFYRAVEQNLGSPDNVMLGLDFKYNFLGHFSWYGQFVLDELLVKYFRAQFLSKKGDPEWGWWANKYAFQTGIKYLDAFGLSNMDLQLEFNTIRPYTYTHFNVNQSYTNFNQSLAHPWGANLKEIAAIVRYQPVNRFFIEAKAFVLQTGIDSSSTENWGGDLLKPNNKHMQDFQNFTTQGLPIKLAYAELNLSYMIRHNIFFDLNCSTRNFNSSKQKYNLSNSIVMLGARMNIASRRNDY